MKTKEFAERVEAMGYSVSEDGLHLNVYSEKEEVLLVSMRRFATEIRFPSVTFSSAQRVEMLTACVEYLNTPLAEREEEKRYWLRKLPVPLLDKTKATMWYYKHKQPWGSSGVDKDKTEDGDYQTIFTESEISQMDITGFEKIEVSE